jgi:hypothetical protein
MHVLVAVNALLWGGLAWFGLEFLQGVQRWQMTGLQVAAQAAYFLYVPLLLVLVTFACLAAWKLTRFRRTALTVQIVILVSVLPYVFPYVNAMRSPH